MQPQLRSVCSLLWCDRQQYSYGRGGANPNAFDGAMEVRYTIGIPSVQAASAYQMTTVQLPLIWLSILPL